MQFGIIGSGSWATALAKILTDNKNSIYWWFRSESSIKHLKTRRHNPQYLSTAYFDTSLLHLTTNVEELINHVDCIVIAVPSAYAEDALKDLDKDIFRGKK